MKCYMCVLFVLLGVAGSFADERVLKNKNRASGSPYAPKNPPLSDSDYISALELGVRQLTVTVRQALESLQSAHARITQLEQAIANINNRVTNQERSMYNLRSGTPGYGQTFYNNRVPSNERYGGYGGYQGNSGSQFSSASASMGPQGGYISGSISPTAPGINSRFSYSIPPTYGNNYGSFSSSSSHSSAGPDGQRRSYNSATSGVNNNGQVSYHNVHYP